MITDNQSRSSGKQRSDERTRYAKVEEAEPRIRDNTPRESVETDTRATQIKGTEVGKLPQISADRPVFTLSVAADLLGLHPRTLRIYEEKQLVVPARTEGNRRRYSQNDINRFQSIRRLTSGGVNLEGVRIILEMADELSRIGGDPELIIERNLPTEE
jgi:MerR family transcriptional regulator, heat shock protein HspR